MFSTDKTPSFNDLFSLVCMSYLEPPIVVNGKNLPGFPSDTLQEQTTGQSGIETLTEAFIFYRDCVDTFESIGTPLNMRSRMLDFGVGWGRIARFFLRDLPLSNIYGIDVTDQFVQICTETFGSSNFHTCNPQPPLSFLPEEGMNFVVGYSVFSHLSEATCKNWMKEFHRLLAPGGIVALTTRGRPFLDYCESLRGKGYVGYLGAISNMFESFDDARKRYDRVEFVHSNKDGVSGGGALDASFYGETFIPESYARTAYSEYFTLEKFLYDPARQSHPIMFFRKNMV
jgi:SAM-dependent methyltransferase